MKKANKLKAFVLLCIAAVFVMAVSVGAVTPRDMIENGAVSDGSVVYGDERDGIVSDVSSEMGDIGEEVSEFVDTVLPDMSKEPDTTSRPMLNSDMTTAENTTEAANDNAEMTKSGATWGIVIAVIVAIAVIALIFFFVKRK